MHPNSLKNLQKRNSTNIFSGMNFFFFRKLVGKEVRFFLISRARLVVIRVFLNQNELFFHSTNHNIGKIIIKKKISCAWFFRKNLGDSRSNKISFPGKVLKVLELTPKLQMVLSRKKN